MSLKYHFQHIKNKTLKNVVFFTFHGAQNETIIFKNQTITIKEQRLPLPPECRKTLARALRGI